MAKEVSTRPSLHWEANTYHIRIAIQKDAYEAKLKKLEGAVTVFP